jgi:hypothetical protein
MAYTAYCMKCQEMVNIIDPKLTKTKNEQPMVKGQCSLCMKNDGGRKGTTVCAFLPRKSK